MRHKQLRELQKHCSNSVMGVSANLRLNSVAKYCLIKLFHQDNYFSEFTIAHVIVDTIYLSKTMVIGVQTEIADNW